MYQVLPNKTIRAPNGSRFIARGVVMFDGLFITFESRTNYNFREKYLVAGKGETYSISEPTYNAKIQYKNADNVRAMIQEAWNNGANMIRVSVEPPVMYATVNYIDPVDGLNYPSDPEMLDTIIDIAEQIGVVVQLQNANDAVPTEINIPFLKWLAARYHTRAHVWINPANEINGTNADVNNPTIWQIEMRQYVLALREDITGEPVGTKFINPVAIDPPGWAERIDLIYTALTTDVAFTDDPNLIINIHYYPQPGDNDFRIDRLPTSSSRWVNYIGQFPIMVGEAGIDNREGRYDPYLDSGVPSINPSEWTNMQYAASDFLTWANEMTYFSALSGVIGHNWGWYIWGSQTHEDNSMHKGAWPNPFSQWSAWGVIFRNKYLSAPVLTTEQMLTYLAGLVTRYDPQGAGIANFQAEGKSGVRPCSTFVVDSSSMSYNIFYNKTTGLITGRIIGNGTGGVSYTTVSDYRLKDTPQDYDAEAIIEMIDKLHPVIAGWKNAPDRREPMFIAHELAEVLPYLVNGELDGEEMQSVDYGRLTPLLAAGLQIALERISKLETNKNS